MKGLCGCRPSHLLLPAGCHGDFSVAGEFALLPAAAPVSWMASLHVSSNDDTSKTRRHSRGPLFMAERDFHSCWQSKFRIVPCLDMHQSWTSSAAPIPLFYPPWFKRVPRSKSYGLLREHQHLTHLRLSSCIEPAKIGTNRGLHTICRPVFSFSIMSSGPTP